MRKLNGDQHVGDPVLQGDDEGNHAEENRPLDGFLAEGSSPSDHWRRMGLILFAADQTKDAERFTGDEDGESGEWQERAETDCVQEFTQIAGANPQRRPVPRERCGPRLRERLRRR